MTEIPSLGAMLEQTARKLRNKEALVFEGRTIAWGRAGTGPDVVLCHGTPFSSVVWARYAEALGDAGTVRLDEDVGARRQRARAVAVALLRQVEHDAQGVLVLASGANPLHQSTLVLGRDQCLACIGRRYIDDNAVGIRQGKNLVLYRSTGIKDHAGMIRCRPESNTFEINSLCEYDGLAEEPKA